MNDDERLSAVLQRAVSTLEPPTDRLVAGGIARGRRQRRIVRGAEAASGAVLVAGVVALIVALVPGSSGRNGGRTEAGGPSASIGVSPVTMTPQALLRTALDTLPDAGTTAGYEGASGPGSVSAAFTFDDGHGTAQIVVAMQYPVPGASAKENAPIVPCVPQDAGCHLLRDGGHAQVRQGHQYNDGRQPNPAEWSVDLVRSDGVMISIFEYNAPRPKGAAVSRPAPPFTTDELIAWAADDAWQKTISAQRADSARSLFEPTAPKAALSGAQASKAAAQRSREVTDRVKAAKSARERAACAAAAAAHATAPAYCATIK